MLELGVDITNPDSVLITRQAGDAPVEEQRFRCENYTLGRRRFTPQPELHIVRPGRLMDNPTRDRWKDLLKGDGLHPGTLQSDGRASWRSFPPLERDCEFNGSAGACYLPASPVDWIDGDDQGDVEGRLVIASLDRDIHKLGVLHGGVTLAGRHHDFQPLLGNAVEFEAGVPEASRAGLASLAHLAEAGAAGKVRFRAGAAGAAPLDIVLDLAASRMMAAQVGFRMADAMLNGRGTGPLMSLLEIALRRVAIECVLAAELGEVRLTLQGFGGHDLVRDTIRHMAHGPGELDAFMASHVRTAALRLPVFDPGRMVFDPNKFGLGQIGLGMGATPPAEKTAEKLAEKSPAKPRKPRKPAPEPVAAEPPEQTQQDRFAEAFAELEAMTGLRAAKAELLRAANVGITDARKLRRGLGGGKPQSLHSLFLGNPGTGKTTVARLFGKALAATGRLAEGHVVEVDRAGLVAAYIGQTEKKVRKVFESARGGVLFIDEAHQLAGGSRKDFGVLAARTLNKLMEDQRDDVVVIAASYPDTIGDFLALDPGLRSRFTRTVPFEDYTSDEMVEVLSGMARDRALKIDKRGLSAARAGIEKLIAQSPGRTGNGRAMRDLIEFASANHASRIAKRPDEDVSDEEMITLTAADIRLGCEELLARMV